MTEGPRTGPAQSGHVVIVTGDGNTPQTALSIPSNALYDIEAIKISYDNAATANAVLELYDEPDGTTNANASDLRDTEKFIEPGDTISIDYDGMRDFEQDVLVATEGNQDDELAVTVQGRLLTVLDDSPNTGAT